MMMVEPLLWTWIAMQPFWQHGNWKPLVCRKTDLPVHRMSLPEYNALCPFGESAMLLRDRDKLKDDWDTPNRATYCCTQGGWYDYEGVKQ